MKRCSRIKVVQEPCDTGGGGAYSVTMVLACGTLLFPRTHFLLVPPHQTGTTRESHHDALTVQHNTTSERAMLTAH